MSCIRNISIVNVIMHNIVNLYIYIYAHIISTYANVCACENAGELVFHFAGQCAGSDRCQSVGSSCMLFLLSRRFVSAYVVPYCLWFSKQNLMMMMMLLIGESDY